MEIEITADPADYILADGTTPMGDRTLLYLDGPATSLIKEFHLFSNNNLVEHIMEYD